MLLNLQGSNLGCQYGPSSRILIWDSQEVTHPSTNRARCCLICELGPRRPELGPWGGDGWMDEWMDGRMEILPCVLQDFVPFGSPHSFTVMQSRATGIADHILPLGNLLCFYLDQAISLRAISTKAPYRKINSAKPIHGRDEV